MKKYIIAGVIVAAIAIYLIFTNNNSSSVVSNTPSGSATGTTSAASGQYKDGAYTGPVTDAVYGRIQVAVTISGGKITSVDVPVYPNEGGHTQEVSASAIPALKQEAIVAQSANVNIVSGATQTSQGFQQSLAAALSQAKA